MAHAVLAPSAASMWVHCSGYIQAAARFPKGDTPETLAGGAAHWVMERCLTVWKSGFPAGLDPAFYVGKKAPNGWTVTTDEAESARVFVDDVVSTLGAIDGGRQALVVEQWVSMPGIHKENSGTLDAGAFLPSIGRLYLWDFKHGHLAVPAFECWQVLDYAEGMREKYGITGTQDQHVSLEIRIVQPRCYTKKGPIDSWRLMLSDIRPYVNTMAVAANKAFSKPSLTAGGHCKYCPAVGRCPAAAQSRYSMIDYVNLPVDFDEMTGRELATEMAILTSGIDVAKKRLEDIEAQIEHLVRSGDGSTGFTLDSSLGRLNWTADPKTVATTVLMQFGVNLKVDAVCTPTQAREKIPAEKREAFDAVLPRLARRNSGTKLVRLSDTKASKVFAKKGD